MLSIRIAIAASCLLVLAGVTCQEPSRAAMSGATPNTTPSATASRQSVLGGSLGPIRIGATAAEVVAAAGQPTVKTVAHGLGTPQWEYGTALVVQLRGDPTQPGPVWQVTAYLGSQAKTEEGFVVGDTRAMFQKAYAGYPLRVLSNQLEASDGTGASLTVDFDQGGVSTFAVLKVPLVR